NPGLIYVKITGFGDTGPYANKPAFDQVIQGLVGFMPVQGEGGQPKAIMNYVVDKITGIWTANATLAALVHRERTGEGQRVSCNLLNSFAAFLLPDMLTDYTFLSAAATTTAPPYSHFRSHETADGRVIGLALLNPQFQGLCDALERPDIKADPRFADPGSRMANLDALYDALAPSFKKLSNAEFLARAAKAGAPFSPVNDLKAFFADPQVLHNQTCVEFEDCELGRVRHINHPARYERTPVDVRSRAPRLGEHTEELSAQLDLFKDARQAT
ncbi:MAG: CaiB/BaiF CoA transferase family protein, partial [Hyphomonadaceae bacterium]